MKTKRTAADIAEELDTTGQESDTKAVKWIQEVQKRDEAEAKTQEENELEGLITKQRGSKNPYYESLFALAKRRMLEYSIPKDYKTDIILKPEGKLIFGLQRVGHRWYAKGMTICGEPKYDINCVERMTVQVMVALDELETQYEKRKTKSGIHLPKTNNLAL